MARFSRKHNVVEMPQTDASRSAPEITPAERQIYMRRGGAHCHDIEIDFSRT